MRNDRYGFTLIELLVVIAIIGVLVAIALPNYIRVKDRAREAEVKSSLHSIQLNLERYATDSYKNLYPYYLLGGDWTDSYVVSDGWVAAEGLTPTDVAERSDPIKAQSWQPIITADGRGWTGDMLIVDGYLSHYPKNPFIRQVADISLRQLTWFPNGNEDEVFNRIVGGEDGDLMVSVAGPTPAPSGSGAVPRIENNQLSGDLLIYPPFQPASPGAIDGGYGPERDPLQDGIDVAGGCQTPTPPEKIQTGNNRLIGNFYYYPMTASDAYSIGTPNPWGPRAYRITAFGASFNLGSDYYDRLGEFPENQRTDTGKIFIGGRSGIWDGPTTLTLDIIGQPTTLCHAEGGPDGRKDGVILVLESGVDVKATESPIRESTVP